MYILSFRTFQILGCVRLLRYPKLDSNYVAEIDLEILLSCLYLSNVELWL